MDGRRMGRLDQIDDVVLREKIEEEVDALVDAAFQDGESEGYDTGYYEAEQEYA